MGQELDEFDKLIDRKNKRSKSIQTQWAKVTSVDWDEKTCEADGADDELPFHNILLGIGSVYQKPKVGTLILIGLINNDDTTPFLIYADEVEEISLKTENCDLKINDGFLLKKENETLKALTVDLLEAIEKMKFTTNQGPTLKLINKQSFTDIKNRFKTFLKDS